MSRSRPASAALVQLAHLCSMSTSTEVHDLEPVLTLADVALHLGVPVQTLYDLRTQGRGPRGFRVGRCLHFRQAEIEA